MPGRGNRYQQLAARLEKRLALIDAGPFEDQSQLHAAFVQHAYRFGLRGRAQFDLQIGELLGQAFQGLAPVAGLQLWLHGDAQALFQSLVQLQGLGVERIQLADDLPCLGLEGEGRRSRQGLARGPVEQLQVQLRFQLGDRHADRLGYAAQFACRMHSRHWQSLFAQEGQGRMLRFEFDPGVAAVADLEHEAPLQRIQSVIEILLATERLQGAFKAIVRPQQGLGLDCTK